MFALVYISRNDLNYAAKSYRCYIWRFNFEFLPRSDLTLSLSSNQWRHITKVPRCPLVLELTWPGLLLKVLRAMDYWVDILNYVSIKPKGTIINIKWNCYWNSLREKKFYVLPSFSRPSFFFTGVPFRLSFLRVYVRMECVRIRCTLWIIISFNWKGI